MILNDLTALNFVVDKASLVEVKSSGPWQAEADTRIESIRKGDITIKWVYEVHISPSSGYYEVHISPSSGSYDVHISPSSGSH